MAGARSRGINGGLMFMLYQRNRSARTGFNALLRTRVASALCSPRSVDDYLELLDSTWSLHEVRARVVAVQPEANDATSLFLLPNENWAGFRAGQFVCMTVP